MTYRTEDPGAQRAREAATRLEEIAARGREKEEARERARLARDQPKQDRALVLAARAARSRVARSLTRVGLLASGSGSDYFVGATATPIIITGPLAWALASTFPRAIGVPLGIAVFLWPVTVHLVGLAATPWRARLQQRSLLALPFPLRGYPEGLGAEEIRAFTVQLAFVDATPDATLVRGLLADAGLTATIAQPGARRLDVVASPPGLRIFKHANYAVHRFVMALLQRVAVPLHEAYPIDHGAFAVSDAR